MMKLRVLPLIDLFIMREKSWVWGISKPLMPREAAVGVSALLKVNGLEKETEGVRSTISCVPVYTVTCARSP